MKNINLTDDEFVRFSSFVKKEKCWVWRGNKDKDGYGIFGLRRKNRRAHRVSYYAYYGMITKGMVIHHECRNKSCVNPKHLKEATPLENRRLSLSDFCKKGHKFDRKYGKQRYCSICQSLKTKKLREKWGKNPLLVGI